MEVHQDGLRFNGLCLLQVSVFRAIAIRTGFIAGPQFRNKDMSLPALKIRLAFVAALLTLVMVSIVSYREFNNSARTAWWIRHTLEVIDHVQTLRFEMDHLNASCREFMWSGRGAPLQSCQAGLIEITQQQAAIRNLTVDNPVQQQEISLLEALAVTQTAYTKSAIFERQAAGSSPADAVRMTQLNMLTDEYLAGVDKLRAEEVRLMTIRRAESVRRLNWTKATLTGGTLLGFLVALAAIWSAQRDNLARASAEKALTDSEEQQRLLLNGVQDYAIFMLDPHGTVVSWNTGAERIKGYAANQIIGQNFSVFFPPEDREQGRPGELLRLTAATGHYEEFGMRVRRDGSIFPADVILTALHDGSGVPRGFSEVTRDLSESKASEARYRALLEAAPDAMVVVDPAGEIVLLNVQGERQFGYRRNELIGRRFDELVPEGFAERLVADALRSDEDARTQEIGTGVELRGRRKDGSQFPIEMMLSPLKSVDGTLVTVAIRNITARKQAEDAAFIEKERAQVTLDCIGDGIASTNTSGAIIFLNVSAQAMTGWSMGDAMGKPIEEVFYIVDEANYQTTIKTIDRGEGFNRIPNFPAHGILVRRDGTHTPIEHSIAVLNGRDGRATGSVIVFRDVSASRAMALQIAYASEHDFLTGLPNRQLLNDRIGQAIAFAARHNTRAAVMFLDLDGFKHINDSLGHPVGDKLLQMVANRLVACVRASDTVSRQGGDEFVILLSEIVHPVDSMAAARRLLDAVSQVCSVDMSDLHVTTSIGVSIYPDDGLDAESLLKNADTAMYQAKENGRQSYRFFEPSMNTHAVERQSIEGSLRRALQNKEFKLNYQPKIDLKTGKISGAEALIRWTHPLQGPLSPDQFIPIAEACGLIVPIGRWVLREACTQARAWMDAGLPPMTMAVNISALDFRDDRFLENVFTTLVETGWDPAMLELELTESALMKRADAAEATLKQLRARGVSVAVDDFGTGYSSLSYLRKFSIDTLKIDQSFIRQLTLTPDETTIVASMISMGRSLKLKVVAEGVENLEELKFLQAHDCDEVQGYYFSQPLPAQQFAMLLGAGAFQFFEMA